MTTSPGPSVSNSASGAAAGMSPGARLQQARQDRKLEISDVARHLNLSPGVVRALESDDYRMLPNRTFVRGYLRSYARMLGLPADELMQGYEALTGSIQSSPLAPPPQVRIRQPGNGLKFGAVALVLALLVGLLLWLWPRETSNNGLGDSPQALMTDPAALAGAEPDADAVAVEPSSPRDQDSGLTLATPAVSISTADQSEPAAPVNEVEVAPVAEPSPQQQQPLQNQSQPDPVPVAASPTPATTPAPESIAPLQPQPVNADQPDVTAPGPRGLIKLGFSGDCWVEVRDASGAMVFSSLKRLGDEVTLSVAIPANVKLGNGDVVNVSFNGKPVAFSTTASRKVVRLTLGE